MAVAVNVADPDALVAISVLAPTLGPSVQLPTLATPLPFVCVVAPVTDPPPDATANDTAAPTTGFWFTSRMTTLGAMPTAVLTVAT